MYIVEAYCLNNDLFKGYLFTDTVYSVGEQGTYFKDRAALDKAMSKLPARLKSLYYFKPRRK